MTHPPSHDSTYLASYHACQVVMDFRLVSRSGCIEEKVPVCLPPRSLLVLSGQARYLWTHGIATRHFDQDQVAMTTVPRGVRVSLTFRTVRKHPNICSCGECMSLLLPEVCTMLHFSEYPLHCDSQKAMKPETDK